MLNNLERKFGRYAIPHLINYLIGGYAVGYLLYLLSLATQVNILSFLTLEPYFIIHEFQLWRLISWVLQYADNVKVVSPRELKEKVMDTAKRIIDNYE